MIDYGINKSKLPRMIRYNGESPTFQLAEKLNRGGKDYDETEFRIP